MIITTIRFAIVTCGTTTIGIMTARIGMPKSRRSTSTIKSTTRVKALSRTRITSIRGTNPDENYVASYVEENPDKFYGEGAEVFTVDELPDEEALKVELLAAAEETPTVTTPATTTSTTRAPPATRTVVVQKRTSGGTWFLLIFGSILVVGVVMLVMYNKGYF